MKKLFVFVLGICLFSCSKEDKPAGNNQPDLEKLTWVKAGANGEVVQNENIYQANGQIKTRLGYKNYSLGLISSKAELTYSNGRLVQTETQMDMSSSTTAVLYSYGRASFEYNNDGLVTQRNNYLKVDGTYKLSSFSVFIYNNQQLPSRENHFMPDGSLYGYSTYGYDASGNIILLEAYSLEQPGGNAVLKMKKSFKYDAKNNPYKSVYHLTENIPFSVNSNNIVETTVIDYTINPQGISSASNTSYPSYNSKAYPVTMNEGGNTFILEYQ
ncbi:MAG: hypothetical protein ACTHMM_23335 [Agriterribacter sp.]